MSKATENAALYSEIHKSGNVPDYESMLESAYSKLVRPGFMILDIGAHGGRHTRPLSALTGQSGRVIAFEPLPAKAAGLREAFVNDHNVEIRELALGATSAVSEYVFVTNAPEESGLKQRVYNISDPILEKITVKVSTLDEECGGLPRIDFIKIDVEGGEIDCLTGAEKILSVQRPIISVEYGSPSYSGYGNSWNTLFDLAARANYKLGDMFGNAVETREEWKEICDKAYWDFFMIPTEKVAQWSALLIPPPQEASPRSGFRKLVGRLFNR